MSEIALFPLDLVLFPGGPLGLRIFETRYLDMVSRCLRESSGFGVVRIRSGRESGVADFEDVGTYARIEDFHQLEDGLLGLSCVGERRFRIRSRRRQGDGLNLGEIDWIEAPPRVAVPARHAALASLLAATLPELGETYARMRLELEDADWVGCRLAEILPLATPDKQFCLEIDDPVRRLDLLAPAVRAAQAAGGSS